MQLPRMFPPVALAAFNLRAMHLHEDMRYTPQPRGMGQETSSSTAITEMEEYCNAAIHPVTGEHITNYMKLKKDPATTEVWSRGFGKEWGRSHFKKIAASTVVRTYVPIGRSTTNRSTMKRRTALRCCIMWRLYKAEYTCSRPTFYARSDFEIA